MKLFKKIFNKFIKKEKRLYMDWISVVAWAYRFNVINWEIKQAYQWIKNRWFMVFNKALTLEEMQELLGKRY